MGAGQPDSDKAKAPQASDTGMNGMESYEAMRARHARIEADIAKRQAERGEEYDRGRTYFKRRVW